MADFASRNRLAIRSVALVTTFLLFMLLGGCATTPKSAATRLDAFAQATTDMGTQVINAYVLDETLSKQLRVDDFVDTYATKKTAFLIEPTHLGDNVIQTRQILIMGLVSYATSLKNLMNDEPITTFSEKAAAAGAELSSLQAALAGLGVTAGSSVSGENLGKAVAEIGSFLMHLKRDTDVKQTIIRMQDPITKIVAYLDSSIGNCASGSYKGKTTYCLGDSAETLKRFPEDSRKKSSGLGADYCSFFERYDKTYQIKVQLAAPSPGPNAKATQKTKLTADQQKLVIKQAGVLWKTQSACEFLMRLKDSLKAFETVHTNLPQAFDSKSGSLAQEINTLNVQIALTKKFYEAASASDKEDK